MQYNFGKGLLIVWLVATVPALNGQEASDDIDVIKSAIQSYVTAFNARDAQKLVSHWSPDGVYTSRTSGEQVAGHEAMLEQFKVMFDGESVPTLAVATESIEFISPNVALERGMATVTHAEDDIVESNYSVVYVKRDGNWLIDRVTEDEVVIETSHYEQLQDLEWLIGEWVDETDDFSIEFECKWTKNQNYISRSYAVANNDGVQMSGLQIIGWDPKLKQIRSWLFDSDGGFVNGVWTKQDDQWVVQSVATLADGGSGSFTSIFRPQDDGSVSWQKLNRVVDGRLLPNIDEVVIYRSN